MTDDNPPLSQAQIRFGILDVLSRGMDLNALAIRSEIAKLPLMFGVRPTHEQTYMALVALEAEGVIRMIRAKSGFVWGAREAHQ